MPAAGARAAGWVLLLCGLRHCRAGCLITPDVNGHVDIPADTVIIDGNAFQCCSALMSISFPSSLKQIADGQYADCSGCTSYGAFGCTSLAAVDLSSTTLTRIGNGAFFPCPTLASVSFPTTLQSVGPLRRPSRANVKVLDY